MMSIKARRGTPAGHGWRPLMPFFMGFLAGVLCMALLPCALLLSDGSHGMGAYPPRPRAAPVMLGNQFVEAQVFQEQQPTTVTTSGARKKVLAVVGVQTGFTTDPHPRYSYENRRAALRATWFPPNQAAMTKLEEEQGIVVRFVVGHSQDPEKEAALNREEAIYGGFWRMPLQEGYTKLTSKSLMFLKEAAQRYDAQYIVKIDDDVYFRLDRLPHAIRQWQDMHAGYVGCFKSDPVNKAPGERWYEPQHALFGGNQYFAHAWGPAYVVSGAAAADLAAMRPGSLRLFNNEDVTVGAWMLALNVVHFDDRRLCDKACSKSSLAVYDPKRCPGLCDPVRQLPELHNSSKCHLPTTTLTGSLPLMESVFDFSGESSSHGLLWRFQRWLGF